MASSDHTQGAGLRPSRLARGGLAALLDSQRQVSADNRWAIYVRPVGDKIAVVKNVDGDQEYQVGNASGKTFTPGSAVLLGSNSGQKDETILAGPPPGQAGQSANPPRVLSVSNGYKLAANCPKPISGRTYLALFLGDYAALYEDGHYIRAFSPRGSLPAGPPVDPLQEAAGFSFQWIEGDLVVFGTQADGSGILRIHTWDAASGVDSAASWNGTTSSLNFISAPLSIGGVNYFVGGSDVGDLNDIYPGDNDRTFKYIKLYGLAVGASGAVDVAAAKIAPVGAPDVHYGPSGVMKFGGQICCPTPGVFDFPSVINGHPAIPSLSGGVFSDGLDRVALDVNFTTLGFWGNNGAPISGGASLRVAAILPAGGNDVRRGPAAWPSIEGLPSTFTAQIFTSVAPSGDEYVIYPAFNRFDNDGFGKLPPALMRLKAVPYPESKCPPPLVTVGPDPEGRYPDIMLARDH